MKSQKNIIKSKLWDGLKNNTPVVFPIEFYSYKEILQFLPFDLNNVSFSIKPGLSDKGFKAYIVECKSMIYKK